MLLLAMCAAAANAQDDVVNLQEVRVTVGERTPTRAPVDLDARSDFKVGEIVAHEYLVVTVTIKADSIAVDTSTSAKLARGSKKASSLVDDLRVMAFAGTPPKAVYAYAMADPRIVRYQAGDRFTLGHQTEIRAEARSKVYIPLNAAIDNVVITPSPSPRPGVSKGGQFNPMSLAAVACRTAERARFPACTGFTQLVARP
jgi:hypothetical protein